MASVQELQEIEQGFWDTSGDGGFYDDHMAEEGRGVFGIGVMNRSEAKAGAAGADPWDSVRMEDAQVVELADDVVALIYEAHATRDGSPPYAARITSVYGQRDGAWKLLLHQQTELEEAQ